MLRAYRVSGRVQGVGFRWFTRETARELGLRGTVRNVTDGTVEVVADGPEEAMTRLRSRLEKGPRGAEVASVRETAPPADHPLPDTFAILR